MTWPLCQSFIRIPAPWQLLAFTLKALSIHFLYCWNNNLMCPSQFLSFCWLPNNWIIKIPQSNNFPTFSILLRWAKTSEACARCCHLLCLWSNKRTKQGLAYTVSTDLWRKVMTKLYFKSTKSKLFFHPIKTYLLTAAYCLATKISYEIGNQEFFLTDILIDTFFWVHQAFSGSNYPAQESDINSSGLT